MGTVWRLLNRTELFDHRFDKFFKLVGVRVGAVNDAEFVMQLIK